MSTADIGGGGEATAPAPATGAPATGAPATGAPVHAGRGALAANGRTARGAHLATPARTQAPDQAAEPSSGPPRSGARSPVLQLTACYLVVRGILLIADVYAAQQSYGGHLTGPLTAWDSHFYLGIAANGYPATVLKVAGKYTYSPAGFPPMFPFLIRMVAVLGVPVVGASVIVSVLCGWAATVLVWRTGDLIGGPDLGFGSALLFMVFPGMGVSWGLTYSECAGTAFIAGALYLMLRERWAWAGVLGACATACNPVALMLAPAALVPAVQMVRRRQVPGALLTAVMTPAGMGVFVVWEAVKYHNLLFYWQLQNQAWGVTVDWGRGLVTMLPHLWQGGYQGPSWLESIALFAVALAAIALWKARLPGFITGYVAFVIIFLFVSNQGLKPRLLSWAFPALMAVASRLKGQSRQFLVLLFAGLMVMLFLAFTTEGNIMSQP